MGNDDSGDLFDDPPVGKAKGGHARREKLSPERRSEIAKKAAKARWGGGSKPGEPRPGTALTKLQYANDDGSSVALNFDPEREGIWATQDDIAKIFSVDRTSITRHIRNIFNDAELEEDRNVQKVHITESNRAAKVYSLDVIISVGYRVNSKVATRFRQWATQALKAYVEQGYVINEQVLRDSPEKLNELATKVRALRASEKQVYAKVRECFRLSSSDYDPSSQEVKSFYALLQDKFHHAVTRMTSSKLILDRADANKKRMGLQSTKGEMPTLQEAKTGKNYLFPEELYRLHLLSEQFLLFAESTALAGRKMTMRTLHQQLDRLLSLNNYPVFDGYHDYLRDKAIDHARREHGLYKLKKQLDAKGVRYVEDDLADGNYEEILEDQLEEFRDKRPPRHDDTWDFLDDQPQWDDD